MLKKMLTTPPIKKIDLVFPLGLEVTARNLRGVTIKDALDAIYKQYKKKVRSSPPWLHSTQIVTTCWHFLQSDDELSDPYLKGFEWDREECYTRFIVHQKKTGDAPQGESKKKKKGGKGEETY
jgi:hypothetical protein